MLVAPTVAAAARLASRVQRREITRQDLAVDHLDLAISWAIASTKGPYVVLNERSPDRIGQPDPGLFWDVRGRWRLMGDFQGDDPPCLTVPDDVLADLRDYLDGPGRRLSLAHGIASELTPARRCEPPGYRGWARWGALARTAPTPGVPADAPANASVTRRPRTMYLGDISGEELVGPRRRASIDWRTWTAQSAVGLGVEGINTCNPSCASLGTLRFYPVRITLSDPRRIHGALMFKYLRLSYLNAVPTGPARAFAWRLWTDVYLPSSGGGPAQRLWMQ